MFVQFIIFIVSLIVLLFSAKFFTQSAEKIGIWLNLPSFIVGVFIVGIGTSLPELISGIIAVRSGASEIVPSNIIGSNASNILLITGLAVVFNKKTIELNKSYLYIDLHFLVGSFIYLTVILYDNEINFAESAIGIFIFIVYSIYLIKGGEQSDIQVEKKKETPVKEILILGLTCVGIYFGADYTIAALQKIALGLDIPNSIVALTLLSLGTTLPELAVNVSAIKSGKPELAVGNVLGSCVFNTLMIPPIASAFGTIEVPQSLLNFALPMMLAAGLFFYLLTQDKKISIWEGLMFICLYALFIIKTAGLA
jgi:cation:H+ antiporter